MNKMQYPKVQAKLGLGDLDIDVWGTPKVTSVHSLFHSLWTFDVSPKQWLFYEDGSETLTPTRITSYNSMLKVTSGGTNGNSAMVMSKRHPRYQPNRGHLYSTAVILPNSTDSGTRDFGLFTDENGVFFRLKSDGNLYGVIRSNSVETHEILIDPDFDIDYEKGNIYDIRFQWRGVGNYEFFIGNPSIGGSEKVLTIALLGTLTELSLRNPALPASYKATNGGTEVYMYSGCVDISIEGGSDEKQYYTSAITTNASVSSDTPIIAIRQPTTINSKINTRDILLARITITTNKKTNVNMFISRDSSSISNGSWSAIAGSYVEVNTTMTTIDTAKMSQITTFFIEANQTKETVNPNKDIILFYLVRGDIIYLDGTASGASVDVVMEFGEEI